MMQLNQTLWSDSNNNTLTNFTLQDPCSAPINTRYTLFSVFAIAVLVTGIIGNSLTISVILYSRKLRTMFAYRLVLSLAIADLGIQYFVTPFKINMFLQNNSFCHSHRLCTVYHNFDLLFTIPSLLHLLVIAIDRSAAISKPYLHTAYFTKTKANIIILILWLYSTIWAGLSNVSWGSDAETAAIIETPRERICFSENLHYFVTTTIVIYFVPMAITSVLYIIIVVIAKKQSGVMKKMVYNSQKLAKKRFQKTFKTVFLVFITYTMCWIPHFVLVFLSIWALDILHKWVMSSPMSFDAVSTTASGILPMLQGCLNPFIYFLSSVHFRKTFKVMFYKKLRDPTLTMSMYTRSFRSERRSAAFDKLVGEKVVEDSI